MGYVPYNGPLMDEGTRIKWRANCEGAVLVLATLGLILMAVL